MERAWKPATAPDTQMTGDPTGATRGWGVGINHKFSLQAGISSDSNHTVYEIQKFRALLNFPLQRTRLLGPRGIQVDDTE